MTQNWYGKGGQYPGDDPYPDWDLLRVTSRLEPDTDEMIYNSPSVTIELIDDEPEECRQSPADHGVDCPYT